ncbi:sodium/proline symporter PutP [Aestuariicella hydrocarbonica]|uniref:Sodium/proline symporter n=1 Tax=Pseudomaricurvus hydrocarbonicus TaxID=1470433 RepID=A0A9E5T2A9_9GAMM|nr:sodium/proline symporter PutP [Aestuariicella hydrocarbonica]NHO68280.1 sodium/proline symporter PutP [Aestuariicella hydrocarbonica]
MLVNNSATVITLGGYLLLMLSIGVYASRRTNNAADYFLGGRSLGPWPSALSAGASDMSGWLLLGLPGYAYLAGIEAFWLAGGLLLGTYCNWLFLAKRLRVYSVCANESLTLPEFFANRFDGDNKHLRLISSVFIVLFYLFYTSAGLVAGGKLFETVFGMDYQWAVILGTAFVVGYTFLGGYLAVSWTDLVQGLLMAAALVYVPVVALQAVGGAGEAVHLLETLNPHFLTLWHDAKGAPLSAIAVISLVGWGLGYFGQPHILARFKGIRSAEDMPMARRIAVGWTLLSMLGALGVGLIGLVYVETHMPAGIDDAEKIFMVMVNALFHPLIAGILLAAILAAIMSTADSQLLVSSSSFAEDIYHAVLRRDAGEKEVVITARLAVLGVSLVALALAMNPDSSVLGLVAYAWAGFGAAFGPALLLSLYWKRMNRFGALAGIIVGGATVVIWKQLEGGWFDLYELVPGFFAAALAVIVVSLLTRAPSAATQQTFDEVEQLLQ